MLPLYLDNLSSTIFWRRFVALGPLRVRPHAFHDSSFGIYQATGHLSDGPCFSLSVFKYYIEVADYAPGLRLRRDVWTDFLMISDLVWVSGYNRFVFCIFHLFSPYLLSLPSSLPPSFFLSSVLCISVYCKSGTILIGSSIIIVG